MDLSNFKPRQSALNLSLRVSLRSVAVALICVLAAACGEPAEPAKQPGEAGVDASEARKIEKSSQLMAEANRALNSKSYDKARKLLREAAQLKVESHRFQITELSEKVDKRQARLWASEMSDRFKQKDCAGAFKDMAEQMASLDSEAFTRELRLKTQDKAVECVTAVVDEATLATRYADARALVNAKPTKTALGQAMWKKIATELAVTITDALRAQLTEDLKEKRWMQAMEKLNGAIKKGDADEAQGTQLLVTVREALTPELEATMTKGIGNRDAATILRVADTLIKLVRWEVLPPDAAELAKDKALPPQLAKKREALAAWVEGNRAGMKIKKKPEKRWTHGKVMLYPASKINGESRRDLAPATEVWIVAQTKERALVTDADPGNGPMATLFEKVIGWVPLDRLKIESTASWVLPNDQLKGARVWAPLRSPDPLLELGFVTEVQGKDISIKRLADDKIVKVQRQKLRSGNLAVGTKVLAFCTAKDQEATIEEVLTAGRAVPSVRIKCDGGTVKEEFLPGLRAKPEFLPPSK